MKLRIKRLLSSVLFSFLFATLLPNAVGAVRGAVKFVHQIPFYNEIINGTWQGVLDYIEKGADVNQTDSRGMTPLHYAAKYGRVTIVELLRSKGASVLAKDSLGRIPLHYAAEEGRLRTVRTLIQAETNSVYIRDKKRLQPIDYAKKDSVIAFMCRNHSRAKRVRSSVALSYPRRRSVKHGSAAATPGVVSVVGVSPKIPSTATHPATRTLPTVVVSARAPTETASGSHDVNKQQPIVAIVPNVGPSSYSGAPVNISDEVPAATAQPDAKPTDKTFATEASSVASGNQQSLPHDEEAESAVPLLFGPEDDDGRERSLDLGNVDDCVLQDYGSGQTTERPPTPPTYGSFWDPDLPSEGENMFSIFRRDSDDDPLSRNFTYDLFPQNFGDDQ